MMQGLEGPTLPSDNAARAEVTGTAAESMGNIPGAEATGETDSATVSYQSPPEGGANARDEEPARLQLENLQMKFALKFGWKGAHRESRAGGAPTRRRRYRLTATWGAYPTRNVYDTS